MENTDRGCCTCTRVGGGVEGVMVGVPFGVWLGVAGGVINRMGVWSSSCILGRSSVCATSATEPRKRKFGRNWVCEGDPLGVLIGVGSGIGEVRGDVGKE